MKTLGFRVCLLLVILLFLAGCDRTYSYLPSYGQPGTAAPPASPSTAPPAPAPAPDLAQQVKNLETRVAQLEAKVGELSAPKATAPVAPERSLPAPSTASYPKAPAGAAEKNFTEGMRLYHSKKYSEARTQLFQYLKSQPKGARAPEARYYLADSFYQEGKYKEAAVEFNKTALQFPQSILTPAALLRQALSYRCLQQNSAYQSTLKKLIKDYPASPEAKEAQKYLKEGKKEASR